MRIRSVKPEFWVHPVMARLPAETRLMALALISWSDDHGYFEADARAIRGAVMPFRDSLKTIDRDLQRLVEVEFIEIRETPTHGRVGRLVNWAKHQRVQHPANSSLLEHFNAEGSHEAFTSRSGAAQERSRGEGKGREGKGEDLGREGKGGTRPAAAKKSKPKQAQPELDVTPKPTPAPKPPTRVGLIVAGCAETRAGRLAELGLDPEQYPDEAPDYGRSAGFVSAVEKRYADWSTEKVDQLISALHNLWLETEFWSRTRDADGKPATPYPWGAFITEKQWRRVADEHFPVEVAA